MRSRNLRGFSHTIVLIAAMVAAGCSSSPQAGPGSFTQQAGTPTVTATPATVAPGGDISITVADGPGNPTDWVGIFAVGDPNTNGFDWAYLSGTRTAPEMGLTAATITLKAPARTGTYEVRFFENNGYTVLATSMPVQVTPSAIARISATPATVGPGGAFSVTVTGSPGDPTDWVGLFAVGAPNTNAVAWQYLSGTQMPPQTGLTSAMLTFTAPSRTGNYELRLLTANSYNSIATSNTVTVALGTGTTVMATPAVMPGGAITINVAGGPGNPTDWVGLFRQGDPNTNAFDWAYLSGTRTPPAMGLSTATVTLTAPSRAGTYEVRLLAADSYTSVATSNAVQVGAAATTLSVSTTTAMPGQTVTVTVTGGPGSPTDWLALAAEGSNDRILLDWAYLSGTQTAPQAGLTSAMVSFTLPMAPGNYVIRLFANDGFRKVATSPTITVAP